MMFKYVVLCTLVSSVALAVDGVILIDQNRALAGNVTPGDTPGLPVSITQPGSYKLSGNLTLPNMGQNVCQSAACPGSVF